MKPINESNVDHYPSATVAGVTARVAVSADDRPVYLVIAYDKRGERHAWPTDELGSVTPLDRPPTQEEVQKFADEINMLTADYEFPLHMAKFARPTKTE
jgi:hypothetical protein